MNSRIEEIRERTDWFRKERFGMFIHWGLYAIPARGEWIRSVEKIPRDEYMKYFNEFNPADYDPKAWARAAKQAGMQYVVMTAKHHDGFCLFDSSLTDFKSTNTPAGRDLIREYVDALRAEGLRVGFYYSIIDWHHEDYPHYGDRQHPMRDNDAYKNDSRRFERYVEYLHGQVRELCTNYGDIDILWFDFSYDDMVGEKWGATELIKMVRELQPNVITDNRLEASGDSSESSLLSGNPSFFSGDFVSPEQIIPPEGIVDINGDWIPWEACITMNEHWGYCVNDPHWKSSKLLIRKLVECVSKGGNLLLNVGPDAEGRIPDPSLNILEELGAWMKKNSRSIYHCGPAGLPKPEWGYYTSNGDRLYAHIFEDNIGPIALEVKPETVEKIRLLADGSEVKPIANWATSTWPGMLFVNFGVEELSTVPLPDETDTVIELTIKDA